MKNYLKRNRHFTQIFIKKGDYYKYLFIYHNNIQFFSEI